MLINMEPQNEMKPFPFFRKNTVQDEGATSKFPSFMPHYSTKRHLIDSASELITPSTKRIKQEVDGSAFVENNEENVEVSSETSLQDIVTEVVISLENNNCENVFFISREFEL